MSKSRIFAVILIAALLFSSCPSGAQIVHEDPDSLPAREPYDADRKLALSLQEMFGSLDRFVASVNASDFEASRRDIRIYLASYAGFAAAYRRSGPNGTDMEAVASVLACMADDLNSTVESAEEYRTTLRQFEELMNSSHPQDAGGLAARLQLSCRNVSDTVRAVRENSTRILQMLDRTDVDTTGLENGIAGLDSFTAGVEESNRKSSGMAGNTSLTLAASSDSVIAGDHILLSGILRTDRSMLSGHLIRFYVDGVPAGSALTDPSGVCTMVYLVDGGSFRRTMLVRAEFDPRGGPLPPTFSNTLEIVHRPEQTRLQVHVNPRTAGYADALHVFGTLATTSGVPAARQAIVISVAGVPAGTAVTGPDGSYSLPLAVRHDMPAGDCRIQSSFEAPPDCALMNATSLPAVVTIAADVSLLTLDLLQPAYHGGENAVFQGALVTGTGRPVAGANVSIFASDVLVGTAITDDIGQYRLTAAIPYSIAPGSHDICASFDPGAGRALTAVRSVAYPALFESVVPVMTLAGVPLIAFPGDAVNLTGTIRAGDGSPAGGVTARISIPGTEAATAVTDPDGSYRMAAGIGSVPGIYPLSVRADGAGLLSGDGQFAGLVIVMPLDRRGTLMVAVIVLLIAIVLLVVLRLAGAGRKGRQKPAALPRPDISLAAVPDADKRVAAFTLEEEIRKIEPAINGDGDLKEAMLSIYRVARLMLRDRDPSLPPTATHRELYRISTGKRPSLSSPLRTITGYYEDVAFRHLPLTREEILRSLRSLNEIRGQLYDGGAA